MNDNCPLILVMNEPQKNSFFTSKNWAVDICKIKAITRNILVTCMKKRYLVTHSLSKIFIHKVSFILQYIQWARTVKAKQLPIIPGGWRVGWGKVAPHQFHRTLHPNQTSLGQQSQWFRQASSEGDDSDDEDWLSTMIIFSDYCSVYLWSQLYGAMIFLFISLTASFGCYSPVGEFVGKLGWWCVCLFSNLRFIFNKKYIWTLF